MFIICICVCLVLPVLKKNYTRLCHCLPQDYKKTIKRLRQITEATVDEESNPMELPTADLNNEAIIASLISEMSFDKAALRFCNIMKELVDSNDSSNCKYCNFQRWYE